MMTSYTKVFKASNLSFVDEVKIIRQAVIPLINSNNETTSHQEVDGDITNSAHKILEDAKTQAMAIIQSAEEKAASLEASAKEDINGWWEENQLKLEQLAMEAEQKGYQDGILKGRIDAEAEIKAEYQEKLNQVQLLISQAFEQKDLIISEAEPFLLELSTVIASQIVKQELDSHPDKFLELIKQHILRFREKEYITICVHPDDFELIQAQRTHLIAVVNGETEIKIIPEHSVTPKGCIIRTAYGSIDARIDTQIEEIKKAILAARREPESGVIG
jgi:flagellar assembly protein FliH